YLRKFSGGTLRGDMITGTTSPLFTIDQVPGKAADEKWDRALGPARYSLARLEGRGLIDLTTLNAMIGCDGHGNTWYHPYRSNAWRITQTGAKVLSALIA